MTTIRALLLFVFAAILPLAAAAEETIRRFDVTIEVETDGDILVTEAITVNAERNQINRGIFRDLPRYFENDGARLPYSYDVVSVRRDGATEPYALETDGNAWRIRIGDADVYLDPGEHAYEIRYLVRNQVRYFDDYDEVYWNVTGTYWAFPILSARATIILPPGGRMMQAMGYTGYLGDAGGDYIYTSDSDRHTFETTRELAPREGLTIALGFQKGLVDPPSGADKSLLWWQRNGSLTILIGSLLGVLWFFVRSFDRVGRDPPKGPVFPRYEQPKGYSPAAVHHIYYRGLRGHTALIATLMNLAVKGRIRIDTRTKDETTLTQTSGAPSAPGLTREDTALEHNLFRFGASKTLGEKFDASFTANYSAFRQALSRKYGPAYFRWNTIYILAGVFLTAAGVVFALHQATLWTPLHTGGVVALAGVNLAFMYLMPAPTPTGQQVRTEIEGFRLYLETAEKLQLNAVEVGSEAPPPMTRRRYEAFLPYAVALGVEKPWTRHFERLIPQEADAYKPAWASFRHGASRSLSGLNASLISSMSSGVSSSLPQSSSSSGSGGGGSSGGGGGGGGGGGW